MPCVRRGQALQLRLWQVCRLLLSCVRDDLVDRKQRRTPQSDVTARRKTGRVTPIRKTESTHVNFSPVPLVMDLPESRPQSPCNSRSIKSRIKSRMLLALAFTGLAVSVAGWCHYLGHQNTQLREKLTWFGAHVRWAHIRG